MILATLLTNDGEFMALTLSLTCDNIFVDDVRIDNVIIMIL